MKMGCMLINHNNGSGSRDKDNSKGLEPEPAEVDNFLTFCLDSYFSSTVTDCPLVIVDDGSTDDSVEIISKYEDKLARFVKKDKNEGLTQGMIEAADILISEYDCDIICRFDGDIEFLTIGWDLRFIRQFESHKDVGAVGAMQLVPYGLIWAFGDMVVHPDGYSHIFGYYTYAAGPREFVPVCPSVDMVMGNMDCDSVMGCLAAFRSSAYQEVGGLRKEFNELRGETEDLNLRLLLKGYRCVALGGVQFIHRQMEHKGKDVAVYDHQNKLADSFRVWEKLWGWNKLDPDLGAVYERWKGTLLTRNLVKLADGTVEYIGP